VESPCEINSFFYFQKACRDEVDKAFEACPDGNLTSKELSGLKYLERCITETQRLFPIIHTITRKLEAPLKISKTQISPNQCRKQLSRPAPFPRLSTFIGSEVYTTKIPCVYPCCVNF